MEVKSETFRSLLIHTCNPLQTSKMPPKERKNLTLAEKLNVLKDSEHMSQRAVAAKYAISLGTVNRVRKRKLDLESLADMNCGSCVKRIRLSSNVDINEQVWQWFTAARAKHIPVSGPILQEKARNIAKELQQPDFKASNGWLEKFRTRYNISFRILSGESAGVDPDTVSTWKQRLDSLIDDFSADNIFNCDETGLFYKALPTKSLVAKGDTSHGTKVPKDRLTVLLGSNMTGTEKLKPLVIGKSAKPRCFKHQDVSKFPVTWKNNKKAWMNTSMFEEWLRDLNRDMARQNRRILLFVDNAPSHPTIDLSNVVVKFFPANCTSELQPMDQGIIKTLKTGYRKRLLRSVLAKIDSGETGDALVKSISVLDAVFWIGQAWNDVQPETIQKCFSRCGFNFFDGFASNDEDIPNGLQPLIDDITSAMNTEPCSAEEYLLSDCSTPVHIGDGQDWEKDIISSALDSPNHDPSDESVQDTCAPEPEMPSTGDVLKALDVLKMFSASNSSVFESLLDVENAVNSMIIEQRTHKKQSTLKDFFKSV